MKEKIEVGYAFREQRVDFGMISDAIGTMKVNREFWNKYCDARMRFDIMHSELISKIDKKHKKVLEKQVDEILKRSGMNVHVLD